MKYLLALILTSLSHTKPVWFNDYSKASLEAIGSDKFILLNFSGSDWCNECTAWGKELFITDTFKRIAIDHLVLMNADFPQNGNTYVPVRLQQQYNVLMKKYNAQKQFPYTVLLDKKGKKLAEWNLSQVFSKEKFLRDITNTVYSTNTGNSISSP